MDEFNEKDSANIAHLFNGIVEQSVAGIYLVQGGVMRYVNTKFADFFGTKPSRMIGRPLGDLAPPEQRQSLVAQYDRRISGGDRDSQFVIEADIRDKGVRLIQIHGRLIEYGGSPAVVGIGVDVTEQEKSRQELMESRRQLRAMMSAVETIQDTERARIAMEIHDDIGGLLTALKFDVARLRRRLTNGMLPEKDSAATADILQLASGISDLAQETINVARRITDELRPPLVDHLGLFAAIRDLIEKFQARYGISCSMSLPHDGSAADSAKELDLFRIIQEILTNVARHSSATSLSIRLDRESDSLTLSAEDNGKGFPASRPDTSSGLGLVGIRERARRIGGDAEIGNVSRSGGARVNVRVPWRFVT